MMPPSTRNTKRSSVQGLCSRGGFGQNTWVSQGMANPSTPPMISEPAVRSLTSNCQTTNSNRLIHGCGNHLDCVINGHLLQPWPRSEEHTSELQSRENLVCRLLLEKKKMKKDK